jgi:ATP-dependent helicase/nuclease subunit B
VPLDDEARNAAAVVAETIGDAIAKPFLPAAPAKGECQRCDFRGVCGPYEEQRTARKPQGSLEPLLTLREMP